MSPYSSYCVRLFAVAFVSMAAFSVGSTARAAVIDQVNDGPETDTYQALLPSPGFPQGVGQTFTAGIGGLLTQIDLGIYRGNLRFPCICFPPPPPSVYNSGFTLTLTTATLSEIFGSVEVLASSVPLRSTADFGVPFSLAVDVSSIGVTLVAGTQYQFIIGATLPVASTAQGGLDISVSGNDYAGGTAVNILGAQTGADVLFRTYVEPAPVPLPAALPLLLAGLGGLGAFRVRRRSVAARST